MSLKNFLQKMAMSYIVILMALSHDNYGGMYGARTQQRTDEE